MAADQQGTKALKWSESNGRIDQPMVLSHPPDLERLPSLIPIPFSVTWSKNYELWSLCMAPTSTCLTRALSNVTWSGPTCHGHFLLMQQSSSTAASESLRHWHGCGCGCRYCASFKEDPAELWDLGWIQAFTNIWLQNKSRTWTSKSSTSDAPDLPSRDHICWLVSALSNHSDIARVVVQWSQSFVTLDVHVVTVAE
jgi:hypothetical protein